MVDRYTAHYHPGTRIYLSFSLSLSLARSLPFSASRGAGAGRSPQGSRHRHAPWHARLAAHSPAMPIPIIPLGQPASRSWPLLTFLAARPLYDFG